MRVFLITVLLMLGAGLSLSAQNKKPVNDKEKVVFDVSMTCENCQKRIEKNIAFEKGVTDMKVDLAKKTVEIEFKKSQTTADNLKAAIEKLGYEVKVHNNEPKKE
ncbi:MULTISPECIES: heavy metal-associated domain-containing protein [unclassified Dysgonomonas]|uniref:heavy-metal-associated domain-containing protein n=1 Tax=unclassified Dysgonomonas TaxID=2630389 RepID=UPI0024746047|nr:MULTISPECIES: heavy metal-associated domain-containing protein [unclassified Dysgonomonas]MDL2303127.1 cation transporter [Dysgonomonas sp. OttesenSCG-928-D17]